jgi:hypothetical protein
MADLYLLINIQPVAIGLDRLSIELAFIQCLINLEKYGVILNSFNLSLKHLRNSHEINNEF